MKMKITTLMILVASFFILMLVFPGNEDVTPKIQDDCIIQSQQENLTAINIVAAPMPESIVVENRSEYRYPVFNSYTILGQTKEEMGVLKTLLTPHTYSTKLTVNNSINKEKIPDDNSVVLNVAIVRLL